jgi:hypothetical protein
VRHFRGLIIGVAVAMTSLACLGRPVQPTPVPARQATPTPPTVGRTAEGLPAIEITALDAGYQAPEEMPAGWVQATLVNRAAAQRNVQFFRINPGISLDELATALTSGEYPVPRLVQFGGGLGTVPSGGRQTTVMNLAEGQYVIASLIHDWYLVPRVPPGVYKLVRVVPAPPVPASALPQGDDGELAMLDYAYTLPVMSPGEHTYKLVNKGEDPHEILIRQINPGKTLADVTEYVIDPRGEPPPYDEFGSGGALVFGGGTTAWMTLNLTPGDYVGICFVVEPKSQKTHTQLGMVIQFEVR